MKCSNPHAAAVWLRIAHGPRVRMANDANCFALSEASDGAAAGARCVFGAILGTGVGAGIVIAGEWGHNPLPSPFLPGELPGPSCYCGRTGCVETWLSGPGFTADARRHGVQASTAAEVVAAFRRGDAPAAAAFERYLQRLARSLAGVVNILDPDAIVLGGGLSNVSEIYERLPALLRGHVFSDAIVTPVLPPVHGDSSGVRGAARLWPAAPGA